MRSTRKLCDISWNVFQSIRKYSIALRLGRPFLTDFAVVQPLGAERYSRAGPPRPKGPKGVKLVRPLALSCADILPHGRPPRTGVEFNLRFYSGSVKDHCKLQVHEWACMHKISQIFA